MKKNNDNMKNASELSDHTGPGIPKITDKELSILTIATVNNEVQYRPGSGVINELISSGKLGVFQNEELKSALASWDGILLKVRYQEQEHSGTRQNLFKILEIVFLRRHSVPLLQSSAPSCSNKSMSPHPPN